MQSLFYQQNSIILFSSITLIVMISRLFILVYAGSYLISKYGNNSNKIQMKAISKDMIKTEMFYSILTMLIFTVATDVTYILFHLHLNKMYININEYGILWFLLSPIILIFLHDAYFYWIHRFMHITTVFKYVHRQHHKSHLPNLWSGFSFHPFEGMLEGTFIIIVTTIMPINPWALYIWVIFMTSHVLYLHNGHEFFKKGFTTNKITKYLTTSTHHNVHHSQGGNYGVYFTFWDKICGTTNPNYHKIFEQASNK